MWRAVPSACSSAQPCLLAVWEMFYCRDPYDGLLEGQICVGVTGGGLSRLGGSGVELQAAAGVHKPRINSSPGREVQLATWRGSGMLEGLSTQLRCSTTSCYRACARARYPGTHRPARPALPAVPLRRITLPQACRHRPADGSLRPEFDDECPEPYRRLAERCWHQDPE